MNQRERAVLSQFREELAGMQVHASGGLGSALKKPLLLLLVIAKIDRGELTENRIRFSEIRDELTTLIERHGGRPTKSGAKPE